MRIAVGDQQRWRGCRDAAVPRIAEHGGRHVTRGGRVEHLEGSLDGRRIAGLAFPRVENLRAFRNSPDYVPVTALRRGAATLDARAVEDA